METLNPAIHGMKRVNGHDLFECLLDRPLFENTNSVPGPAWSIRNHLKMLLNSKRGSIEHLPDYGLPDISEIYQDMPNSLDRLCREIERVIRKYEPRLKNVKVTLVTSEMDDRFRATYLVRSEMDRGDHLHFRTSLNANGEMEIL
jgi:type VI secretion system protein